MRLPAPHTAALITALLAGAVLGAAEAAQHWGGVVPCALCLVERWPWRVVIVLGLIGAALPRRAASWMLGLCVVALLAGAALGGDPCRRGAGRLAQPAARMRRSADHGTTLAERLASMPDHPSKPCDAPTYLIPRLPISMAAMNLIAALVLAGLVTTYLVRGERSAR